MITLYKQAKIGTFEYFYFFVMVIYMARMVGNTARMIAGVGSPYFPFLFPIFLTIILLDRHKVKFDDKRLIRLLLLLGIWTVLLFAHKTFYEASQYSYFFFLFYSIVIAYIHVQVFGTKMIPLYESIITKLSLIALVLWAMGLLFPSIGTIFKAFPESNCGNNVLYLYNWVNPAVENESFFINGIIRNAGCSWEPGRFSIMVVLGLFCNLIRKGIKFKGNWNALILLLTIGSTLSTTGFIATIVLYGFFVLKKFNLRSLIVFFIILIPIGYQLSKLDFMGEKIEKQLQMDSEIKKVNVIIDYHNKVDLSNEYISALGRFQSIYFHIINIEHDPILGFGMNPHKSYYAQRISGNFSLTGGFFRLFGQLGIPLALIIYFFLYKSSVAIGQELKVRKTVLFALFIIFSISYDLFTTPIFTAFWFYGLFRKEEDLVLITENNEKTTEEDFVKTFPIEATIKNKIE